MARIPGATPITFTLSASSVNSTIYTTDISQQYFIEDFNRTEFDPNRLQSAKDYTTFATATIVKNAVGGPVQIGISDCGFSTPLYLGPTDNFLSQIMQRFTITEFRIEGSPSSPSAVNSLMSVYIDHKRRLDDFAEYQSELEMDISYQRLVNYWQAQTFSYLTTTGLSMSTYELSQNNCLITDFNEGLVHYDTRTNTALSYNWSMVLQVRSIQSRIS